MNDRDVRYKKRRFDRRRNQSNEQSNLLVQFGRAIVAIGRLLFGRPKSNLNSVQLLADFARIDQLLDSNDPIHAAQAVVQADAFVDRVMQQTGGQGSSFADRLRSLEPRFDRALYQRIWDAHKVRNEIAHQSTDVSTGQARNLLQVYRRAASALGAF